MVSAESNRLFLMNLTFLLGRSFKKKIIKYICDIKIVISVVNQRRVRESEMGEK